MGLAGNLNVRLPLQKKHGFQDPRYSSGVYSRTARCRHGYIDDIRNIFLLLLIFVGSKPITAASIGKGDDKVSVCESAQCKQFSESLKGTMDLSVNPCDDFFQYVCGNFNSKFNISKNSLQPFSWINRNYESMFTRVMNILRGNVTGYPKPVQQAKDLFDICMDEDKDEEKVKKEVNDIVTSLISPPHPKIAENLTDHDNLSTYRFDWLDTIIKIKTHLGLDVLISVGLIYDPKNSTVYRITMGAANRFPSLKIDKQRHKCNNFERSDYPHIISTEGIPEFETLDKKEQAANSHKYLKLVSMYLDIKLKENEYFDINQTLRDFKDKVYEISHEVTNNSQNLNTCINNVSEYSVDDIQAHTDKYVKSNKGTPRPIWKRYLEGLFKASDVTLDFEQDKILISPSNLKYMEKIALLISETDPVVLELYIVSEIYSYLSEDNVYDRSKWCTSIAYDNFKLAIAYAILRDDLTYLDSVKHKVLDMVDEIKHALKKIVAENQWLDLKTKQSIDAKLSNVHPFIATPEWLFEAGKLEEYYKGIEVNRNISFLGNVVNISRTMIKNSYRHPDSSMSWIWNPIQTNAYYVPFANTLTVEYMMTQFPFFYLGLRSLNYGSLGMIVGHELSHGFDNCGRHFDMNGNMIESWSNDSIEHFNNKTRCFEEQYSSFNASEIITGVNQNVNGKKTLNENIADNGGLRAALAALQHHLQQQGPEEKLPGFTNMTSEQLFFLSYTHSWCEAQTAAEYNLRYQLQDVHPPKKFRVRGTLQNSEEFAKAWKCPAGSDMNPVRERCAIF